MIPIHNAKAILSEWITTYMKNRDIHQKRLKSINQNDETIVFTYIDKIQEVIIEPDLRHSSTLFAILENAGNNIYIVTMNTIANLNFLIENWEKFIVFHHLALCFVNPDSKEEKRWIVFPHTHNSISIRNSLAKGLNSMFETVECVN